MKIKFISLNLWFGGLLLDDILDFLEKENADIIALQEVFDTQDPKLPAHYRSLEALQARLHYPHQDFAPAVLDKFPWGNIKNGNAILSRFPIHNREVTFFDQAFDEEHPRSPFDPKFYPITPRNLEHVMLETPAGEVNIFNLQGVWDLDGDSVSPQRQKMSDTILHAIKSKSNVIVAGDTNAKYTNPAMRAIEKHLTNVFGDSLATTFNMKRKDNPGYAKAAVDMIYQSRH